MENKLREARNLYNTGHEIKNDCLALIELTKNETEVVLKGYYAASVMVSSKYIINPFKKLPVFNDGKAQLEDLISENFDSVELRYLRYTIQLNIPKLIGYYKNIETDREVLTHYLRNDTSGELAQHILFYLRNTKDLILERL